MFPKKFTEEDRWDSESSTDIFQSSPVRAKRIDKKVICVSFDEWTDVSKPEMVEWIKKLKKERGW